MTVSEASADGGNLSTQMTGSLSTDQVDLLRPRAPGALGLVQSFVNTFDMEADRDAIETPAGLSAWLVDRGLPGAGLVRPADVERARRLREAIRASLEHNAHPGRPSRSGGPVPDLATAAGDIELRVAAGDGAPALVPAGSGVEAALGWVLAAAVGAAADGSWSRLKVCRNDACRWAYWDASRNRSGVWCTMAVCGNRAKGRAFRGRTAGRPPLPDQPG